MRVFIFITLILITVCKSPQKKNNDNISLINENSTVGEDFDDIVRPEGMSDLEFEKYKKEIEKKRQEEIEKRNNDTKPNKEKRNPFSRISDNLKDDTPNNSVTDNKKPNEEKERVIRIQLSPVKRAGAIIRFKESVDKIIDNAKINRTKREKEERENKDKRPDDNQPKPTIKTEGKLSDIDLQDLYKKYGRNSILVMQAPGPYKVGLAGMEDKRLFETVQFKIKKTSRLKSYNVINGAGKDYNLYRSPVDENRFYFLSDRTNTVFKTNEKDFRNKVSRKLYNKIKNQKNDDSGTGFLEIVTLESAKNKNDKMVFYNSKFSSIKDLHQGNKLGYTLYNHNGKLRIIYSAEGDLHTAESTDGVNFEPLEPMDIINSGLYTDRDPSISPDGRILAFASSRNMESNIRGTQLFISVRENINSPWKEPVVVPYAMNSLNELFPVIFQYEDRYFVFVRVFNNEEGEYKENLYSIEIREGIVFPMVPLDSESDIPYKYLAIRDNEIFGSYPANNYDIYNLEFETIEKIYVSIKSKVYK